jgi:hypothetical protein
MTKARVTPTSKTDWRRYLKQRGILRFAEDNCLSRTTGTVRHHILHCCASIRGPNYKENIGQKTHYKKKTTTKAQSDQIGKWLYPPECTYKIKKKSQN